ncbi:MAG: hypothetical protein EBQ82_07100 [Betaproteobacteria bacterium]|nr:hypothetical protein [Betaproteobacteria bacterium]
MPATEAMAAPAAKPINRIAVTWMPRAAATRSSSRTASNTRCKGLMDSSHNSKPINATATAALGKSPPFIPPKPPIPPKNSMFSNNTRMQKVKPRVAKIR